MQMTLGSYKIINGLGPVQDRAINQCWIYGTLIVRIKSHQLFTILSETLSLSFCKFNVKKLCTIFTMLQSNDHIT